MTTTTNWNGPIATTEQIAELRAEVAALRAELVRMRLGFGDEVRTRRVAVVDGDYSTTIEPGHVTVEKRTAAGCRVDIRAASDGAEVIVAGHVAPDEDEQVSARLYAGDAGGIDPPTAFFAIGSPERGLQRLETLDDMVLSVDDVARALKLFSRDGAPDRRAAHDLIRSGAIRAVDHDAPISRWTVSRSELERYVGHCERAPGDPNATSIRWW